MATRKYDLLYAEDGASLPPPKPLEQGEDFSKWVSAVEMYMGAINVTSTTQKANILLHLLGPDTQDILDTLPEEDGTDEYVQLTEGQAAEVFQAPGLGKKWR